MPDAVKLRMCRLFCDFPSTKNSMNVYSQRQKNLVGTNGVIQYAGAVEICRLAKVFQYKLSKSHLIQQLAKRAPDADTQSDWRVILTAYRAFKPLGGGEMNSCNSNCSTVFGLKHWGCLLVPIVLWEIPLMLFPQNIIVTYIALLRGGLFQLEEASKRTFDEWATYLQARLQDRSERTEAIDLQRKFRAASNLWSQSSSSENQDVVPCKHQFSSPIHRSRLVK